ncbi:MAG: hypothetical protein V3U50_03025, partial [Acidimicrobiia bacterium]
MPERRLGVKQIAVSVVTALVVVACRGAATSPDPSTTPTTTPTMVTASPTSSTPSTSTGSSTTTSRTVAPAVFSWPGEGPEVFAVVFDDSVDLVDRGIVTRLGIPGVRTGVLIGDVFLFAVDG